MTLKKNHKTSTVGQPKEAVMFENLIRDLPPTLTFIEACELLKVTRSTLNRLRVAGEIIGYKIGKGKKAKVIFLARDIANLLERSTF